MIRAIYLLGFRGSGKTTLGRRLAAELAWDFFDLDEEWERRNQRSILGFVEENGIEDFRAEEYQLLRETASLAGPVVIATGGGVVDHDSSRAFLLAEEAPKIYLAVSAEDLWRRLENQPERLKIGGLSDPGAFGSLLERRIPFFEKIATYRVENRDITQALTAIKHSLGL